jgi:MFS family permease
MILNAIKQLFTGKLNIFLVVLITTGSDYLYYLAIISTGSLSIFLNETPTVLLIAQVFFSLLNSLLIGVVITMFIDLIRKRRQDSDLSFSGAIVALFFSVVTTGCYVCGTVLLPAIGVAASFAALPFGGLEVKVLTVLLLIYSLKQTSKTYLGICDYDINKKYQFSFGNLSITLSSKRLNGLKSFAIVIAFSVLILSLPSLIPDQFKKEYSESNICLHEYRNNL